MSSSALDAFKTEKQVLGRQFAEGKRGLQAAISWTEATDEAVRKIWNEKVNGPSGWALVALGSYGRKQLCPLSDVDLLILHVPSARLGEASKALSYALWDAGLELGLSTATPRQSLKLADGSLDSRTAYLDARFLGGDEQLFRRWNNEILQKVRSPRHPFSSELEQACLARWEKAGDAGAELEPNLKDGKGGLRDLSAIRWIGSATGSLTQATELSDALEFILTVRQALHWFTGRRTDVLVMQHHRPVAEQLGTNEEALMRTLYRHCRTVAFVLEGLLAPNFPHREAAERFTESFTGAHPEGWSAEARESFFEIVSSGKTARRAFRAIEKNGALAAALPQWEHVICLPQRNIYHRWAVDVHSFETAATIVELSHNSQGLVSQVAQECAGDLNVLALSALLHDIGKGTGSDHSKAGEKLAAEAFGAMGLEEPLRADAAWLVRNHLLLSETAVRRDIGDESLIVEIADQIGSLRRLRMLYLLSVADALATGPEAWTDWKSHLVSQLFVEVGHLLERGELVGGGASAKAASRTRELHEGLRDLPPDRVSRHLAGMPRAWLLSGPVEALSRQSRLVLTFDPQSDPQILAVARKESGSWEVTVVAHDRPALVSKIAGVLAVHGLNVLSAQIFTRDDGVALEVFGVHAVSREADRFKRVAEDARRAIQGDLPIEKLLADKRRDYSARPQKGKGEAPSIVVDNQASDFYTVLEVHAPDRTGLLYSITDEMARQGLDIHLAKVATYAQDVVDSFYVRDLEGQKVTEPAAILRIKQALLARMSQEAAS